MNRNVDFFGTYITFIFYFKKEKGLFLKSIFLNLNVTKALRMRRLCCAHNSTDLGRRRCIFLQCDILC